MCTWSSTEWAGCFQTGLLETLVRVALSCAPGAAFVLADVCAAEWADKTAEYWSPVPVLPLYRSPRSFFIYFASEKNEGVSWCFLHSLFSSVSLCLRGVSPVCNDRLLPPQQLLNLWWSSCHWFEISLTAEPLCLTEALCKLCTSFAVVVVVVVYLPLESTSYRNRLGDRNYFPQWSEYVCSQSSSPVTPGSSQNKDQTKQWSGGPLQAGVCGLFANFHTFFSPLFAFHPSPTTLSMVTAAFRGRDLIGAIFRVLPLEGGMASLCWKLHAASRVSLMLKAHEQRGLSW